MTTPTVIPGLAPPPPQALQVQQRPMIRTSLHPRGARPYVFGGKIDEWHAPGAVVTKRGDTMCAVDAAWLVERVLGRPKAAPHAWPGVPGARERAIWAAQQIVSADGKRLAPYQADGAAFLAERDWGILADEMGLGKTAQTIVAAEARLSMAYIPSPQSPVVLIVCPSIAKRVWQAELKRWVGHDAVIIDSRSPDPAELCARYVIVNYDILYGSTKADDAGVVHNIGHLPGWGATLASAGFLIAIFDEVHMLRSRTAVRTKAAKQTCAKIPVCWGLSGTPMPNYTRDLFAPVDVLSGGLFGWSYWKWAQAYCGAAQGMYGMVDTGSSRADELQGRLATFMIGRSAASVRLQLPEKRREIVKVDVAISAPTVADANVALAKKGQLVADALRATAKAKLPAVVDTAVESLMGRQKVVVFVYMRQQADAVAKAIKKRVDCAMFCVSGDTTPAGRYEQAKQFREVSAPACFVGTIDAMGVALSLVGAHRMIFGDLVPEPWKLLQAEKRPHRFDSRNCLLVTYMIATGTIDEAIAKLVLAKIPVIEQTIGQQGDAGELTEMLGGRDDGQILDELFSNLQKLGAGE